MAIGRYINPGTGLIVLTVSGNNRLKDIIQALKDMLVDPQYKKSADILWDFRDITTPHTNSQEIRELVSFIRKNRHVRGSGYRVALVVSRDLDYGIARMYDAYSEGLPFQMKIFREFDEAYSWVDSQP